MIDTFRILWHSGYWDGPTSGMCMFNDKKCWFETEELGGWLDEDTCEPRLYKILEISDEQIRDLEERHHRFRKYVGSHTDYDENGKRTGKPTSGRRWEKYYGDPRNKVAVFTGNERVIGHVVYD